MIDGGGGGGDGGLLREERRAACLPWRAPHPRRAGGEQ